MDKKKIKCNWYNYLEYTEKYYKFSNKEVEEQAGSTIDNLLLIIEKKTVKNQEIHLHYVDLKKHNMAIEIMSSHRGQKYKCKLSWNKIKLTYIFSKYTYH